MSRFRIPRLRWFIFAGTILIVGWAAFHIFGNWREQSRIHALGGGYGRGRGGGWSAPVVCINLSDSRQVTDERLALLKDFPHLRKLYLDRTLITDDGLKHLDGLRSLQILSLDDTPVGDEGLAHVALLNPRLLYLLLHGTKITSNGMRAISPLTNLGVLDVSMTQINDAGIQHLLPLRRLCSLNLADTRITNDGLKAVAQFSKMRYVDLCGTQITDDGLKHLAPMQALYSLRLNNTRIGNDGLKHISTLGIGFLDLSETDITDDGLEHLAKLDLKQLDLFGTKVTDDGIKHLSKCVNLEYLVLPNTSVSIDGLARAALPKLQRFNIRGTEITRDEFREFNKMLPKAVHTPGLRLKAFSSTPRSFGDGDCGYGPYSKAVFLVNAVVERLKELNPGFNGSVRHNVGKDHTNEVLEFEFVSDHITDIKPIAWLKSLKQLNCSASKPGLGRLSDVTPLKGLPLESLILSNTQVGDDDIVHLTKCVNLHTLWLDGTNVTNAGKIEIQRVLPKCKVR